LTTQPIVATRWREIPHCCPSCLRPQHNGLATLGDPVALQAKAALIFRSLIERWRI
jgi:hypothetical protein